MLKIKTNRRTLCLEYHTKIIDSFNSINGKLNSLFKVITNGVK